MVKPFNDEQARILVNLEQRYQVWLEARQAMDDLPYDLRRKRVKGRDYLYEIDDRGGNGRSLGPWSEEKAARHEAYRETKTALTDREKTSRASLAEVSRLARAARVPAMAEQAAVIVNAADRRGLIGTTLLVIGTNAMAAYDVEAGGEIGAPQDTQDFDLAWIATEVTEVSPVVWPLLKAVDPTFTVNTERPFQARNARGYEVELLAAPSRIAAMARTEQPLPVPLDEQEWLLLGRPVDRVVIGRNGTPARLVVPDPRWFGLHKVWMSLQAKRNPLKRPKDRIQGRLLLDAVRSDMPQYPLDEAFQAELPDPLRPIFEAWLAQAPPARPTAW